MSEERITVAVRVVFHAAHRLPELPGKCRSLHGHTWQAWFRLAGPVDQDGVLVDFTELKRVLRSWCMTMLDHGTILGADDPLVETLAVAGTKLYVVGTDDYSQSLAWPTVETMAHVLHRAAADLLPAPVAVVSVELQETENNRACCEVAA